VANTSKPRLHTPSGDALAQISPWALSPSDFAFLWDDCPRCFYLKVAGKQPRPRTPFPSVFGKIDRAMKDHYLGERAEAVAAGMPAGVIGGGDRWVKSAPLLPPEVSGTCFIRGRVDVLIDCDDGTKGVVDFKTTVPKADHLATYGRQLHAYAMALEHPASGRSESVSSLGLLCFLPESYQAEEGRAGLFGPVQWIEVPRDDLGFAHFLGEVVSVLEQADPPEPAPDCSWCALRDGVRAAA
jgi:PD-(D/E)XK nuclease superfamily